MSSCLINDKTSLKQQLLVSYSLITVISAGITLGICYGLLYSLKNSASTAATDNLLYQTNSNAKALATEIANAINQKITIVGESVCMVGARYASILLSYSHSGKYGGTILEKKPSYREYYFDGPCSDPHYCPSDYGALYSRSRFPPYLTGFVNGSLLHSSVYLFDSSTSRAARNNQTWMDLTKQNPAVNSVIDALTYQDRDMNLMYTRGPNTTVMFYLSTKISVSSSKYIAVHRTFPGIVKNITTYDPPNRSWFTNALQNSYNLYGPYVETFTKQNVITLSTLSTSTDRATGQSLSTVAAGVMLISELSSIVNSVQYTNGGYGVLFKKTTLEVLVWKDESYDTLKSDKKSFKVVTDFQPNLAGKPISSTDPFEYSDSVGVTWIVSPYPFLWNPSSGDNRLVILVFARKSQAEAVLDSLNSNIDSTTSGVVTTTIIIIAITVAATILLCFLVIEYIAYPLEAMRKISEEITRMTAEDEDKKDYRDVIRKAFVNLTRTDEVGILAIDYYSIVCLLHNKNMSKRDKPKYPPNPFHIGSNVDYSQLTWSQFMQTFNSQNPLPSKGLPAAPKPSASFDVNVLGSLNNLPTAGISYARLSSVVPTEARAVPEPESAEGMAEIGSTEVLMEVPAEDVKVGWFTSLKSQLYMLSTVLLAGVTVTMIITVVSLSGQGATWMSTSSKEIDSVQVINMQAVAYAKSAYVEAYYQQLSTDVLIAAAYMTDLFNQNLTDSTWYSDGNYLPSYSDNFYDTKHQKIVGTTDFSLYYSTDYAFCNPASQCDVLHNSTLIALTSLSDMKLRSFFHSSNFISFVQFGMEQNGTTRYLPFTGKSSASDNPSNPASCQIPESTTDPTCLAKYHSSKCSDQSKSTYLPYDPRCRSWYTNGKDSKNYNVVAFQEPRSSSSGIFVQTAYIALKKFGQFTGVLNSNYLASRLSTVINSNAILKSGYCYLIDSNTAILISHPRISATCADIKCVEGFSSSEYTDFQKDVLIPIQLTGKLPDRSVTYMKQGKPWRIIASKVEYENIHYTVFATVRNSEVQKTSTDTTNAINSTVNTMIYVFSACIFTLLVVLVLYSWLMISLIVNPINDLRTAFALIRSDDLNSEIPTKASSRDLKILLGAFGQLLVALRFGSESYAKGDPIKAKSSFSDALNLFTMTGNKRGVGSSQNNLSAAELALGNSSEAEANSKLAIRNAEDMLQELTAPSASASASPPDDLKDAVNRARRVLSDRRGNLAIIFLQQDRFEDAFELIEKLLLEDREYLYIRGLVVKQGTLGHYYLKQGEVGSAERVFYDALQFIKRRDENMFNSEWNSEEAEGAEQIALFNMCALLKVKKEGSMEAHYLKALCSTKTMHTATVTMIITALKDLFVSENRRDDAAALDSFATQFSFTLDSNPRSRGSRPKRVAFVIDYSGSMSGSKIRSAIENVQNIFENHIQGRDSIMVMTFNGSAVTDIAMSPKSGNEEWIANKIAALVRPSGGTALYSAMNICLQLLHHTRGSTDDWIVALTDGDDNCSAQITAETVKSTLRSASVGLVIIGIGNDVQAGVLKGIADAAAEKKGTYLFAHGDKKSIDDAFGEVVAILSGGTFVTEEL